MVINSQIERHSITLVNEDKLYDMKPQRFEKYAVELMYRTVVAIQSPHQPLYEGLTLEMRHNYILQTQGSKKPLPGFAFSALPRLQLLNS